MATRTKKPARLRAAFQGEPGAFSHQAAMDLLGPDVAVEPRPRFEDVFNALRDGEAEAAVIPIENTLHDSVHENYDHLLRFDFTIVAETNVRIVHNLIAAPGVRFKDVQQVYSHPVALNQCLDFLRANPQFQREPFYDTAGSVKMVVEENRRDAAAIASAVSAQIYGAKILKRSIEDDRQNYTRFFLLRREDDPPVEVVEQKARKGWKTSLVFTVRDQPGALFKALSAFALRDLSMAKIESRPLRGKPWEYLFYVDVRANTDDPNMRRAIAHLEELADMLRLLGCYRA
jgi:prephenate dehydratase